MSSVAELPGQWTRWRTTAIEWLAVILAGLSLILSIASLVVSSSSAIYLHSRVTEQQTSLNTYRIRAAKLNAWLAANGVPVDEIYGEDNDD